MTRYRHTLFSFKLHTIAYSYIAVKLNANVPVTLHYFAMGLQTFTSLTLPYLTCGVGWRPALRPPVWVQCATPKCQKAVTIS